MLVGAGALDATDEVIEVADVLGAGVAKALLGKAAVPDDVPFCTGAIGLLGTRPSWEMMQEADTLLMVGTSFPYSEVPAPGGQGAGVQIDIAPRMLSLRYPMEVNLCGDCAPTLRELLPLLRRKQQRGFQEGIVKGVADWWRLMDDRAELADRDGGCGPRRSSLRSPATSPTTRSSAATPGRRRTGSRARCGSGGG